MPCLWPLAILSQKGTRKLNSASMALAVAIALSPSPAFSGFRSCQRALEGAEAVTAGPFPSLNLSSTRLSELRADASLLLKAASRSLVEVFDSTGFGNYDEYVRSISTSRDRTIKKLIKILNEEKVEVVINASEHIRAGVQLAGLQNQRVAGTSKSRGSSFTPQARDILEANMLGMKVEDYAPLDAELKPKYAYLRATPDQGLKPLDGTSYGDDAYVLKLDAIRDRITFTLGDSSDLINGEVYTGGSSGPETWNQVFIPWENRALIVPALVREARKGTFNIVGHRGWREVRSGPPVGWIERGAKPSKRSLTHSRIGRGYIEIQVFGPLRLDDVEIFEFGSEPPSGKFLKALKEHHIKIRDNTGSTWPPVDWEE
jgi:hypothetical protein